MLAATDPAVVDWSLLVSLTLPAIGAVSGVTVWSIRWRRQFRAELQPRISVAKASLEGEKVVDVVVDAFVPGVARAIRRRELWGVNEPDDVAYQVKQELARADSVIDLDQIRQCMADERRMDRLPILSRRVCRSIPLFAVLGGVAWTYFACGRAIENDPLPEWSEWVSFSVAAGCVVAVVALLALNEVLLGRLGELLERHGG